MADRLHLRILTPNREVLAAEVDSVVLPAEQGECGILPGHAALLATLQPGQAEWRTGSQTGALALSDGFLEVSDDAVTVLVRSAEVSEEIDADRAQARLEEREAELRRLDLSEHEMRVAELSLQKQLVRLQVAKR